MICKCYTLIVDIYFTAAEGDSVRLEAGTHRYPFRFSLPSNVPSSYEGEYGYVRYTAEAKMDRPWKFDHVTCSAFTVISLVDLNLEQPEFRVNYHVYMMQCCTGFVETAGCLEIKKVKISMPGKSWKSPGILKEWSFWFKYRSLEKKFIVIHCVHFVTIGIAFGLVYCNAVTSKTDLVCALFDLMQPCL